VDGRSKKPTSFVDVVEEMRKLHKTMRERNELLMAKSVQDLTWEVNAAKDKIIEAFKDELRNSNKVRSHAPPSKNETKK
jgi:glycosyltransferase involved in cell wall biosynthesis